MINAAGSQMRVTPEYFKTSTRVVTSKVRQPAGADRFANKFPVFGNTTHADTMLVDRRKSRRFIDAPFGINVRSGVLSKPKKETYYYSEKQLSTGEF